VPGSLTVVLYLARFTTCRDDMFLKFRLREEFRGLINLKQKESEARLRECGVWEMRYAPHCDVKLLKREGLRKRIKVSTAFEIPRIASPPSM